MRKLAILALPLVLLLLAPEARAWEPEEGVGPADRSHRASDFDAHVRYLASDELGGRGAGTAGGRLAGSYVATCFDLLGLEPGADGSFFQPFGDGYRNVVGVLPGTDLADEAVLVGGHYDHLGDGTHGGALDPVGGRGEIHNGADDNASGTAAIIEIAEAMTLLPPAARPRRTIVFCAFDAEEKGLLGATHYVEHPVVPLEGTVAMINMDMIGRARETDDGRFRVVLHGTDSGSGFRDLARRVSTDLDLAIEYPSGVAPNSDHFPFYRSGVPVMFPFTGLHPDYHRASDEEPDVNDVGGARIARLVFRLTLELARADERPAFREAEVTGGMNLENIRDMLGLPDDLSMEEVLERARELFGGRRGGRPRLGVTIEGASEGGVVVRGVREDMPAGAAGIEAGDVILSVDGRATPGFQALRAAIGQADGETTIRVRRDGEELELIADLGSGG